MTDNRIQVVENQDNRPQVKCPSCKRTIIMDLRIFEHDASKIVKDKCPYCGQLLYTALLICAHPHIKGVQHMIQKFFEVLKPGNQHLYGTKTH